MDVQIRWKDVPRSHHLEEHLASRLRLVVGRLKERVTAVRVCFEDGVVKRCTIELEGALGRLRKEVRIHAEVHDTDLYVAAHRVADEIGRHMKAASILREYA